jgi:hypothetical protein
VRGRQGDAQVGQRVLHEPLGGPHLTLGAALGERERAGLLDDDAVAVGQRGRQGGGDLVLRSDLDAGGRERAGDVGGEGVDDALVPVDADRHRAVHREGSGPAAGDGDQRGQHGGAGGGAPGAGTEGLDGRRVRDRPERAGRRVARNRPAGRDAVELRGELRDQPVPVRLAPGGGRVGGVEEVHPGGGAGVEQREAARAGLLGGDELPDPGDGGRAARTGGDVDHTDPDLDGSGQRRQSIAVARGAWSRGSTPRTTAIAGAGERLVSIIPAERSRNRNGLQPVSTSCDTP